MAGDTGSDVGSGQGLDLMTDAFVRDSVEPLVCAGSRAVAQLG